MMFRVRSRIPSFFLFCFLAALVSPVTNHLNYGLNPNDVLLVSYSVCSCSFYVWSVTSFHLTFFDDFIAQCLHNLMSGVMLLFTSQDKERDKPKTHTKRKDKKKITKPRDPLTGYFQKLYVDYSQSLVYTTQHILSSRLSQ